MVSVLCYCIRYLGRFNPKTMHKKHWYLLFIRQSRSIQGQQLVNGSGWNDIFPVLIDGWFSKLSHKIPVGLEYKKA